MLAEKAKNLLRILDSQYPGRTSIHYPFKCNSVPAVVKILKNQGLKAEVMTEFELELARHLGFGDDEIIVNGPCKTISFLNKSLNAKLIVIDSISELNDLIRITNKRQKAVDVLLRINPDYVPYGMNSGSATGSRKGSAFGLDLKTGEPLKAIDVIKDSKYINFKGLHFHIGTGIRIPDDYSNAIKLLEPLVKQLADKGFGIEVLDTGGGFAAQLTRGLTTTELLLYQGLGKFPTGAASRATAEDFIKSIISSVTALFRDTDLPELIIEPGRYLTSDSQILLLKVHRVKERKGAGKWLITDGGIGTVTMPAYYEYHEMFPCTGSLRKRIEKVTISGPCCFAEDVVYKNKLMPEIAEGEILAMMDCGAYFSQWESNFGFYKSAMVSIESSKCRLIRRRESFIDLLQRDEDEEIFIKEDHNEICSN